MVNSCCSLKNSSCSTTTTGSSSSRYRRVSKHSTIDESLFGERTRRGSMHRFNRQEEDERQQKEAKNCASSTTAIPKTRTRRNNNKAINCLSKDEIDDITKRTITQDYGNNSSSTAISDENYSCSPSSESKFQNSSGSPLNGEDEIRQKAIARKEYMLRLELEKTEVNQSSKCRDEVPSCCKENELSDEKSKDILKLLNTCKQRAAAFAIRDQQLKDKALKNEEEREYEKLKDIEMEINRLKDIAKREKEEEAKLNKRKEDRKIIEEQMKEREHQKLLEEEARDQENRKMMEAIKRREEEEAQRMIQKRQQAKQNTLEIMKRNEEILKEREARKAFEQKEEQMILAYVAEQDEKLRKREQEEEEARKKKIEIQKKLLENQSKILDKKAEIDEIRARRAAEENERKHRQRELEAAQKRKMDMKILQDSRREQEHEKVLAKEREMAERHKEYQDAMAQAAEMAKRESEEAETAKQKNSELRQMLQHQIQENARKKKLQKQENVSEGNSFKVHLENESKKLEKIRDEMVADMRSKGVDEKYFGEMLTLDIARLLST